MKKYNNLGLLLLRVTIGTLMLLHGLSKMNGGIEFIQSMLIVKGLPAFISYGVLIGEVIAPIAIIIGFRTRIAALIFAFNCIVAILLAHPNEIFTISKHGGWAIELLGLYMFSAIVLVFTGAGKYTLSRHSSWD